MSDKRKDWEDSGVCEECINYRLELFEYFEDSYNNFNTAHSENCSCFDG